MKTTHLIFALIALLLIGAGTYFLTQIGTTTNTTNEQPEQEMMPVEPDGGIGDGAEPLDELLGDEPVIDTTTYASQTVIGQSVNGTDITAYHFGNGSREILLIAGMHGSDAPNTTALATELRAYFAASESAVPDNTRVTIIPTVNPDGLADGSRFNANNVDLNRNFACDWSATSMWREQEVSGGSAAFSEPEAVAIRDYVNEVNVAGAIVWFAAEGKVYPSACGGAPSTAALELATTFANAADYPVEAEFDAYQINGDMVNWMADQNIPAISVLLTNRTDTERTKNQAGIEATLEYLSAN